MLEKETNAPVDPAKLWPEADAAERQRVLDLCGLPEVLSLNH
jgi:hypothetical protein